jgi:hypothetical protein
MTGSRMDGPSKFCEKCHWCFSILPGVMNAKKHSRVYWRGKYFCHATSFHDSCLQKFLERGFTLPKVEAK